METRETIIEKLYVLRSILSLISIKYGIYNNINIQIDEKRRAIRAQEMVIYNQKKVIETRESIRSSSILKLQEEKAKIPNYEKQIIEKEKLLKKEKGLGGYFKKLSKGYNDALMYKNQIEGLKKDIESCEKSINYWINSINNDSEDLKKNRELLKKQYEVVETHQETIRSLELKLEEKRKVLLPACNAYYEAAIEIFHLSGFLDVRDWDYIDLMLFFLETRRGDSLKEALRYVDEEKRANRISASIAAASYRIASTISYNISQLRNDLNNNFNVLNTTINNAASQIASSVSNLNSSFKNNISSISSQMSELADQVKTGNALKAKIESSSTSLMHDVNYIVNEYKKYK